MAMILRVFLAAMIMFLSGCGGTPAPIDRETSDTIGKEFFAAAAKKGYQPPLNSSQVMELLTEAFDNAGYSYSATLRQLASDGISVADPAKFQFATFLLMPVMRLTENEGIEKYYSGDDLKAVNELVRMSGVKPSYEISNKSYGTGYEYKGPDRSP